MRGLGCWLPVGDYPRAALLRHTLELVLLVVVVELQRRHHYRHLSSTTTIKTRKQQTQRIAQMRLPCAEWTCCRHRPQPYRGPARARCLHPSHRPWRLEGSLRRCAHTAAIQTPMPSRDLYTQCAQPAYAQSAPSAPSAPSTRSARPCASRQPGDRYRESAAEFQEAPAASPPESLCANAPRRARHRACCCQWLALAAQPHLRRPVAGAALSLSFFRRAGRAGAVPLAPPACCAS